MMPSVLRTSERLDLTLSPAMKGMTFNGNSEIRSLQNFTT